VITNATLTGFSQPPTPSAGGDLTYGSLTSCSGRCLLDEVRRAQRIALEGRLSDASAVMYLLKSNTPAGYTPAAKQRLQVALDDSAAQVFDVLLVRDNVKAGGLSHWEVFLKELT
jgi:hypothetical protein